MTWKHGIKAGRPREYALLTVSSIPRTDLAFACSLLRELRLRVVDQFADLPQSALSFKPEGTDLSIGVLVVHLVWAEAGWMKAISNCAVPPELRDEIHAIGQALPAGTPPPVSAMEAAELVKLCHRVGEEVTDPALAQLQLGLDEVVPERDTEMTPRGVLMHLIWHWTYHSGHIGLIRELWGSGYTWRFGSLGTNIKL
ncbi:MAG: DinB family protein [Anaerolineae bacterium]|nr:DinB family protein [Anaerolineae bacterium]